jgi:hypothetical protein
MHVMTDEDSPRSPPFVTARDRSIPNAAWRTTPMTYTAAELAFYSHPVPGQTANCHLVMARIWHDTDRHGGCTLGTESSVRTERLPGPQAMPAVDRRDSSPHSHVVGWRSPL